MLIFHPDSSNPKRSKKSSSQKFMLLDARERMWPTAHLLISSILLANLSVCLACFKPNNSSYTIAPGTGVNNCTWTCDPGFYRLNSTCLVQSASSDPYSVSTGAMQILQIYFNISCLSHGCWVIDVAFSKSSSDARIALYLPRVQVSNDGLYTRTFNESFLPSKFPCSTSNLSSKAATTCCLEDFVSQYHVIASFSAASSCNPSNPNPLIQPDSVYGHFSNLPISTVIELPSVASQSSIVSRARILLDDNELRSEASIFSGTVGVVEQLDLFVGLAQFIPTGSPILDSSVSQLRLSLTKSDYFTVTAYGHDAYTFLSFINVQINEVLDETNPSLQSQYATVSFVLNDNYSPNPSTQMIPPTSVLVGYGSSEGTASWVQSCEQPVSAQFAARLSQACGPSVAMCASSPTMDPTDRFVTINIPLQTATGGPLFDLSNSATLESIFVQLVVSVLDPNGQPVSTTLNTMVSVVQGGVATWCDQTAAVTTLEDVVQTVDLLVGTAGSEQDLARLQRVVGIQATGEGPAHNVTQSVGSRSIQSGLLTLAMQGKESYFAQPGTTSFSLQLEDVVTLHIMGDSKMSAVMALLSSTTAPAFQVVADKVKERASLVPAAALSAVCGSAANPYPQASCVLRYDVQTRAPSATAYDISAGSPAAAGAFMETITGASDYAEGLGANFSALISRQYALNSRYRRAFWINPGFTWTGAGVAGADRFTLSQWLVMVALVDLDENTTTARRRRRGLLTATTAVGASVGAPSATVQYGVGPAYLLALNLGLALNQTSTWLVTLQLTAQQACSSAAALAETVLATIEQDVAATSTGLIKVGLVSVELTQGSVACRRLGSGRRLAATAAPAAATGGSGSDPTAAVYFIAAFESAAYIDLAKFSSMPGVVSIQQAPSPGAGLAAEQTFVSGGAAAAAVGGQEASGSKAATTAEAAVGVAVALAAAAGLLIWRMRVRTCKERAAAAAAAAAPTSVSVGLEAKCLVECQMCFVEAGEWEGRDGGGQGPAEVGLVGWMVEASDASWPVYMGGGPAKRWITADLDKPESDEY